MLWTGCSLDWPSYLQAALQVQSLTSSRYMLLTAVYEAPHSVQPGAPDSQVQ